MLIELAVVVFICTCPGAVDNSNSKDTLKFSFVRHNVKINMAFFHLDNLGLLTSSDFRKRSIRIVSQVGCFIDRKKT